MKTPYDFYDYPQYWQKRDYEDLAEKQALKVFFNQIPAKKGKKIIDIGAGFGRHTPLYAPLFKGAVLLDPSQKLLQEAKKRLKKYSCLTFQLGKAEEMPFDDSQFEVALIIRVIHHLPEPKKAFQEALRVLKPQGYLILEFANKIHFRSRLKAWLKGNFSFNQNLEPSERGRGDIFFFNHHPKKIEQDLEETGFKIIDCLSVSNFRILFFKRILPLRVILFLSAISQKPLAKCYFGPSIFLLCKKP
jgi:ubiquinone/menaquinone biosynthesis C-methylase UbiE